MLTGDVALGRGNGDVGRGNGRRGRGGSRGGGAGLALGDEVGLHLSGQAGEPGGRSGYDLGRDDSGGRGGIGHGQSLERGGESGHQRDGCLGAVQEVSLG